MPPLRLDYGERVECFSWITNTFGTMKLSHTRLRDIWNSKVGVPYVRAVVSENHFKQIFCCLRFDDPDTRERRKYTLRLAHIQELVYYLNTQFQNSYATSERHSGLLFMFDAEV